MEEEIEEKRPKFTTKQKWTALRRQLFPYRRTIYFLSAAGFLSAIGNGVIPYITGKFLDTLITPENITVPALGTIPLWVVLLGAWTLIQLANSVLGWYTDLKNRRLETELEASVVSRGFSHLLTLPISFHKENRVGEITDNLSKTSWMLGRVVNTVTSLAPQFLTIAIGIVISFLINPLLAWVLLLGVAVYIVVLVRILPTTAKYQEEGFKMWSKTYGDASDAYANFQTVKQAGAEEFERTRIMAGFRDNAVPLWYRIEMAWGNLNFSQRIIVTLTQFTVFLLSVFLIADGKITIGELIAFNAYGGMILGPFVSLGGQWQTIQNGLTAVTRSELIFAAESEPYALEHAQSLKDVEGGIRFENVHFSYGEGQQEVLKGISFEAAPGDVIAFVGETGAGKSTTADLISGYYFPTQGSVQIDGVDLRMANLRELRSNIGVVPQEVVLFNTTIKDNIRYGRLDATDEEVKSAALKARADAFIDAFPKKYEQEVGERGVKLSVGQKQRVAIARAILRNPKILILDEPTSALDSETERYISASLDELMKGRTTFIIAHRLSTVRKADKIIVLKDGLIAEQGKHDELMAIKDGVYKHLYSLHVGLQ